MACENGAVAFVNHLWEKLDKNEFERLVHQQDPSDGLKTVIHKATQRKRADIVKFLADKCPSSLTCVDSQGLTALHVAALADSETTVAFLLGLDFKLSTFRDAHGYTPLHSACHNGKATVVSALIEAGCDLELVTDDGATPYEGNNTQNS